VNPTRTLAVALLVVAVVCAFLGVRRSDATVEAVDRGEASTPLWSPRRVPQPIVDAVGGQRLQAALDAAVVGAGVDACFVVDEGGAPIAARAPDLALVPASTEKIITAVAALAVLGADSHLETRAVAAAAPKDGVLDRLWLVGGGDFLLMTPEAQALREQIPELRGSPTTSMTTLADAVVAAGVRRISGGIIGDDSRYETLRYLPTWKDTYRTEGQVGPLGALTVNGGFSQLQPEPVPVQDPAVFAAAELARLLEERGVTIGRGADRGKAPDAAVDIAKVESAPMTAVVGEMISASDNLGAELLTREIGFREQQLGTTAAGITAITQELNELGLPTTGLLLVDGSGLDRGNRVTCQLLDATLDLGAEPAFAALWSGLAVAGQSGTLIDQLDGTPLEGKLRGKTGSLDGVTGLVGIIEVGRSLRFAFIANGAFTETGGIGLRGQIASIIATFPDAPPGDVLVPLPAGEPATPEP
jgi:D-alanyl-D-alanine carboxypeptidase/D-alanyl-D-alanine-endopeptidase (penicillin-binding protein 4)